MGWKERFSKKNVYFETENGILFCGDSLKITKTFPDESIDLILTDPPYGIGLGKVSGDESLTVYLAFLEEAYRLLKENSYLITYCYPAYIHRHRKSPSGRFFVRVDRFQLLPEYVQAKASAPRI